MRYVVIAMIVVLFCIDFATVQAKTPEMNESLRGLSGVRVVIEEIDQDAKADGLSEPEIRTAVELILRSNGVRVLTESESLKTASEPFLYVSIFTFRENATYALTIKILLFQKVILVHRPQHTLFASTWDAGNYVGTVGRTKIKRVISEGVEPQVKAFANDFLAANPR